MQRSHDIRVRSFQFAVSVISFARSNPWRDPVLRRLVLQLVDAASSVGANLEEAQAGQSKRDFVAKNCIALKEAREARYWLKLLTSVDDGPSRPPAALLDEASQIIAMLVALIKTARSRP